MKIYLFLFLLFLISVANGQHILVHDQWRAKIDAGITLIKQHEPELFEGVISRAYIQIATCAKQGMTAFATREYHQGKTIDWIIIDHEAADGLSSTNIASLIVHEALHLKFWEHGGSGKIWSTMTNEERDREHTYIYNYQLDFLKKTKADQKEIDYYKLLMSQLGISVSVNSLNR